MSEAPSGVETENRANEEKVASETENGANEEKVKSKLFWAEKVWNVYKRVIAFPASSSGAEKKLGIVLYILCLVIAIGLVVTMVNASDQSYTDYKIEAGTSSLAVKHRVPDIIVCPLRSLTPKYKFNVVYNEKMIDNLLGMNASEVDEITHRKFDRCPKNQPCSAIEETCSGPYAKYCEILSKMIPDVKAKDIEFNATEFELGGLATPQKVLLQKLWESNGRKWSLDMLWTSIISYQYTDHHPLYSELRKYAQSQENPMTTIECFFYGSAGSDQENAMCEGSIKNVWIDEAYCGYIPGSAINETDSPYIGFRLNKFKPFMFWMGSLESMKMNLENFVGNGIFSGYRLMSTISVVIHYSMIEIKDQTRKHGNCQDQPMMSGIKLPCLPETGPEHIKWFYEFNNQNRYGVTVWIYAKTKQMVTKKNSFTTYTQIQFTASLFSCFLGISVMQIVQVMLSNVRKLTNARAWIEKIFQMLILAALVVISIMLTTIDLTTYFENRYSSVFKEKQVPLPVPLVQICNDWWSSYGFMNSTRFRDFNVSLTFANYIRYVGFQQEPVVNIVARSYFITTNNKTERFLETLEWMSRNLENGAKAINNCSDTERCWDIREPLKHFMVTKLEHSSRILDIEVHMKESQKLRAEAIKISQQLGHPDEASVARLMEPFLLDPKLLIKQCRVGEMVFDCGKYARYMFETGKHEVCLVLEVQETEAKFKEIVGIDNALVISYDVNQFKKYSDVVSYYGPGVTEEEIDGNATCSSIDRYLSNPGKLAENFTKSQCSGGRSWKLKIAYPKHYTQYIQIQHPSNGLAASESHIVELRLKFEEKLQSIHRGNCYGQKEISCERPREETIHLSKGMQLYIWCRCAYCFTEDVKMLGTLSVIVGNNVKCCTVSQLTECYTGYLKQTTTTANKYMEDEPFQIMANMMAFDISGGEQSKYFASPQELKNPTVAWFRKVFHQSDRVDNETMERFFGYMKKCFRQPCKQYTFELFNYQNEKIDDGFVNVTVFYGMTDSVGIEEVDRFELVGFIGILVCGYNVTFGIGFVGLFEMVYMLLKRIRGKRYKTSDQLVQDHLLRAAAFLTDRKETSEDKHTKSITAEIPPKDDENNENKSFQEEIEVVNENVARNRKANIHQGVNIAWSDLKAKEDAAPGTSNEPVEIEKIDSVERIESAVGSRADGYLYFLVLLFATIIMLSLLVYFFVSADNHEYNADVIAASKIQKPSVALCADSSENAKQLEKALKRSTCRIAWKESTDCRDHFWTFVRNKADRFCYVWDNSHEKEMELSPLKSDLVLDSSNDMPEVLISVQGWTHTSITKLSSYIRWNDQNILMGYTTQLKTLDANCEASVEKRKMGTCPSEYQGRNPPFTCGLKDGSVYPLETENPCVWFQYRIGLAYSELEPNRTKRLEVKSNQINVLVFSVKSKRGPIQLLSIIGGFFGSFIEITILSLFSLLLLLVSFAFANKKTHPK